MRPPARRLAPFSIYGYSLPTLAPSVIPVRSETKILESSCVVLFEDTVLDTRIKYGYDEGDRPSFQYEGEAEDTGFHLSSVIPVRSETKILESSCEPQMGTQSWTPASSAGETEVRHREARVSLRLPAAALLAGLG
jgi:hypothetical protein